MQFLEQIVAMFTSTKVLNISCALGLLMVGYFIARKVSHLLELALDGRFSRHHIMLLRRILFYIIFTGFIISALQQMGFNLSVLLGAAGVFTVAISFASQTAVSNLISGIFLLFEHPFKVGDTVEVKGINGIVDSIDLLSTKLKTSDNKLVRIPNEAMIKSEIINLSYFDTRRLDLVLGVGYQCDIPTVKAMLIALAVQCDEVLKDPEPNVVIENFANSAIEIKFMVWVNTSDITRVKNKLQENIKHQFEKEGIEMPSPQVTILRTITN